MAGRCQLADCFVLQIVGETELLGAGPELLRTASVLGEAFVYVVECRSVVGQGGIVGFACQSQEPHSFAFGDQLGVKIGFFCFELGNAVESGSQNRVERRRPVFAWLGD